MSEASELIPPPSSPLKHGRRIPETHKQAIVAAVASGMSQTEAAQLYNVHLNTVNRLCQSVKRVQNSPLSSSWRAKLVETLPQLSVDAIERSLKDTDDVHKAAGTAIQHLKGIGVLAQDGAQSVNVFLQQVNNLPADWQTRYAFTTPTSSSELPDNGATDANPSVINVTDVT